MATWKISREIINIIPHPNPEVTNLELAQLGLRQTVIRKNSHKSGDIVIFVPEKSLLPDNIANQGELRKYLKGPLKNRVSSVKLQKELSEGLILPDQPELSHIPIGDDISSLLNITEYLPVIPPSLSGTLESLPSFNTHILKHDVEQFNLHKHEFIPNEEVIVTEKLHGSQIIGILHKEQKIISSKGILSKNNASLKEDTNNTYWKSSYNSNIWNILSNNYNTNDTIQFFGEVIPCQKGYNYGFQSPTIKIFRLLVNSQHVTYDNAPPEIKQLWVPILYQGPYNTEIIYPLREGLETVSGKSQHIREGIVISPVIQRKSKKYGFYMYLKLINPAYKDTGEEFN
jgi:RNA ligase (TIGR02306 family)